jgi:hypothetical protein
MKKYSLIAKQHFSGIENAINIGDEIKDLTPLQVNRFLESDSAEFKTKKDYDSFLVEFQESEKERLENEAKAKAILNYELIKNELIVSYEDAVKKEAELLGLVYDEEIILNKVEELLLRVEPKSKKAK